MSQHLVSWLPPPHNDHMIRSLQFFFLSHKAFDPQLKWLFVAKLFHSAAMQLSLFFLPVYLFSQAKNLPFFQTLGLSQFQQGMIVIGGYFLIQRAGTLVWTMPVSALIRKIGLHYSFLIGQLLYIVVTTLYILTTHRPELLLLTALLEGIKIPLFWNTYNTIFSNTARYEHMGSNVGTLEFLTKLIHALSPWIAGSTIVLFGYSSLFVMSVVLHVLSLVCMTKLHPHQFLFTPSLQQFREWLKEPGFERWAVAVAGKMLHDSMQLLWPFFVFLLVGSVDEVGLMYSLVFFISLILIYFSSWYLDHRKGRQPFLFSGGVLGLLWIGRWFVAGPLQIMSLDVLDKLAHSLYVPFFDTLMFRRGRGRHALSYFTYRELLISAVGIVFWVLFIGYFWFFESWRVLLLLGLIGVILSLQLVDKKNPVPES